MSPHLAPDERTVMPLWPQMTGLLPKTGLIIFFLQGIWNLDIETPVSWHRALDHINPGLMWTCPLQERES